MATIAILSVGVTGRVHASCEIARRLKTVGHEVIVVSTHPGPGELLEVAGVPFYLLDSGVPAAIKAQPVATAEERRQRQVAIAAARGRAALGGNGIDEFLAVRKPDLLLVESELHASILYLLGRGVPIVLLEYHLSIHRQPRVPPLSSTLTPSDSLLSLRAAVAWRWMLARRGIRHRLDRRALDGWDARSVWHRIARGSGATLADFAREDQWPMLYYPGLPCIHLCAPELDYPGARASLDYAGPVIQRVRPDPPDHTEYERCRDFLRRRDRSRPLVASATGSILTLPGFSQKIIDASESAGYDLVLAAGRGANVYAFSGLPENVRVFQLIPQLDVLAEADLFVCHGGIASIHESLLAGVPMLVCSGGQLDENGNAARVEYHSLGLRGDMDRDSPTVLRRKIDTLLASDVHKQAVGSMQKVLRKYRRDNVLEKLVEMHLKTTRMSTT